MAKGPSPAREGGPSSTRNGSPTSGPVRKFPRSKSKSSHHSNKVVSYLGYAAIIFLIPVGLSLMGYKIHQKYFYLPGLVNTPSDLPKVLSEDAFGVQKDAARFWGSYRSNLYFGMRTRSPDSPVFGIMWYRQPQITGEQIETPKIRHWCDSGDSIKNYGWKEHDGLTFGIQDIIDQNLQLQTSFIKVEGGDHGGEWTARVNAEVQTSADRPLVHHVIFYMALPGWSNASSYLRPLVAEKANSYMPQISGIDGFTSELGNFRIRFSNPATAVAKSFLAGNFEKMDFSQLKEMILGGTGIVKGGTDKSAEQAKNYMSLVGYVKQESSKSKSEQTNLVAVQMTFLKSTTLDITYESKSADNTRKFSLIGEPYTERLKERSESFSKKFETIFGFDDKNFPGIYMEMGKVALSNMLGSIGYFNGFSIVQSEYTPNPVLYGPHQLFTAVPSRPFFPRGFLWDEGFHQLLIGKWDRQLSMEIMSSWMDLMNVEGWIPREMILGAEAQVRVPREFIVQHNAVANPPVFFFVLGKYLEQFTAQNEKQFFKKMYPRLKLWYKWLNNSQTGPVPGSYRWRGRNETTIYELNPKTLPSGLDDYPRASHPSNQEYHLDLYCWIASSTKTMAKLAKIAGDTENEDIYEKHAQFLSDSTNLDALHWSDKSNRYCDYGLHTRNVKLEKPKPRIGPDGRPRPPISQDMIREVMSDPKLRLVTDTFGYVSLYPFFMKLLAKDSEKLGTLLDQLEDGDLLWTPFGLRSLAKSSPHYAARNTEHDPPYWRGNIWINMNYLALASLHHYSQFDGPYRDKAFAVYGKLRGAIVGNLVKEFRRTGYLWENYNDENGKGQGTHPFTGWSSLVLLMMSEQY